MWEDLIRLESKKDYYKEMFKVIKDSRQKTSVYPKDEDLFNAFKLTPLKDVRVVIIGQDPYHQPNQAHGLAFSTLDNKTPKSLINIKKELEDDLGIKSSKNNNLTSWAKQGVLLINTILTVEQSKPLSHKNIGWERFTKVMLDAVFEKEEPVVFVLWGNKAIAYEKYITNKKHLVIKSSHPSPLSVYHSFWGSKPFSKINNYLKKNNLPVINFKI